mmetsp:Transcript_13688/g.24718  ORF Transcript_13688/g.24718 Transcript_13688/m.24718 type:complete len:549 (-) Transcript_13688:2096-3742(-)
MAFGKQPHVLLHRLAAGGERHGHQHADVVVAVFREVVSSSYLERSHHREEVALRGRGFGDGFEFVLADEVADREVLKHTTNEQPPAVVAVAGGLGIERDGLQELGGAVGVLEFHREVFHAPKVDVSGEQRMKVADERVLFEVVPGAVRELPQGTAAESDDEGDADDAASREVLLVFGEVGPCYFGGLVVILDVALENEVCRVGFLIVASEFRRDLFVDKREQQLEALFQLLWIREESDSGRDSAGLGIITKRASADVAGEIRPGVGHRAEAGLQEAVPGAGLEVFHLVALVVAEDVGLHGHAAYVFGTVRHAVDQKQVFGAPRAVDQRLEYAAALFELLGVAGGLEHRNDLYLALLEGGLAHLDEDLSRLDRHLDLVWALECGQLAKNRVEESEKGPEVVGHDLEHVADEFVPVCQLVVRTCHLRHEVRILEVFAPERLDDQFRVLLEVGLDVVVAGQQPSDDVNRIGVGTIDVELEQAGERLDDGVERPGLLAHERHVSLNDFEHVGCRELLVLLPVEAVGRDRFAIAVVDGGQARGELERHFRGNG